MFVSKCKITLSLYHYCVASLPTDTIKIIITHFTIRYCKHTHTNIHTFKIDPAYCWADYIKSNFHLKLPIEELYYIRYKP